MAMALHVASYFATVIYLLVIVAEKNTAVHDASVVTAGGVIAATFSWFVYKRKEYIGLIHATEGIEE